MPENLKQEPEAKVVHLEPESQRIIRAKLARLPSAVHAVHDKGKQLVLGLLKAFFDRADDSLFELADKAQSNQEQNLYFDSMREVRVQRRTIEKRFSDAIDEAFASLVTRESEQAQDQKRNFSSDALSLVDNDELEEMVALDASVARANADHGEAIQLISLRLDSLVPVKVYQKNNPLGPDVLCSTFMEETKRLDVGIKAKLVLFKLFDKSVVAKLGDVYAAVNDVLKDNNVLPSLSSPPVNKGRRAEDRASVAVTSVESTGDQSVSPHVLSTLKNLLGERVLANPNASTGTQIAANELVQLLSRAQHLPAVMDSDVAINVRGLLTQLQQKTGVSTQIGQVDDQVINLVHMLFEFILDDRNLAAPMKALLSRMQIPIIKVAVADKAFFTKGSHVARRLLNEMASAAMGWTGDSAAAPKDALYRKIESIVRTLIEEFDTDLQIFHELLADFSDFLEKEKKRAAVLERRTIDAEDGKAKAEVARTTVAIEIELRTLGQPLPKVVDNLVANAWSNVLFVTALKFGYESDEWAQQLKVLEHLVASVQAPKSAEQRQKLIKLVPVLVKRLRAGLDTISYNPFEMSDLFKSLEKVHLACIRGKRVAKSVAQASTPSPQTVAPVKEAENSFEPAETKAVPAPKAPAEVKDTAASPEQTSDAQEVPKDSSAPSLKELSEASPSSALTAAVAASAPSPAAEPHLDPNDPWMQQVARFAQGAWFDMVDERSETTRCRLAAFIKPTGKYIFVNRSGMKVAEKSQVELALLLKDKRITVLDNSVLFDRALETVVTSLRKH